MELITRQTNANKVAKRWGEVYRGHPDTDKMRILEKLIALGDSPDPDDVDAIIGNTSWTSMNDCDECGKQSVPFIVMVGQEPNYESRTAYLCGDCIGELARLIAHHHAAPKEPTNDN